MNGSRWDQEVIVGSGRPLIDVSIGIELCAVLLGGAEVSEHRLRNCPCLHAQIDSAVGFGIEDVVALILGVVKPEVCLDVFGDRVNLKREVATAHGVQKIESDRELGPESCVHRVTQQRDRFEKDQIIRRYLDRLITEAEKQAVLLGDAVETPRVVGRVSIQPTDLLHPMPAP
ncbi:MAG: hypothetical protein HOJ56_05145 [Acidimicrobiaceae bacterium]|nr:hypothetical protein [Acidimicrobiaceae bacterium]